MSITLQEMKQTYEEYSSLEKKLSKIKQILPSINYGQIEEIYEQIRQVRYKVSSLIETMNNYSKQLLADANQENDQFYLELLNKKQNVNATLIELEEDFYQCCFNLLENLKKTVEKYAETFLSSYQKKCDVEEKLEMWERKYDDILSKFSKISFPFFLVSSTKVELEQAKEVIKKIKSEIKEFPEKYKNIKEEKTKHFERLKKIKEWKERFEKIMGAYHRIKIEELAEFLGVKDIKKIKKWIIEDKAMGLPIKLDRDSIIITSTDNNEKKEVGSEFLDLLDTSFRKWTNSEKIKESKS
ncbi:MAG: hypothetical protein ACTSRR_11470 [Candidatus Heimdallarchaeaceae archaeon]